MRMQDTFARAARRLMALGAPRVWAVLTAAQMREGMADLASEIRAEAAEVARLAMDGESPLADLQARQEALAGKRGRYAALREACAEQEAQAAGRLAPEGEAAHGAKAGGAGGLFRGAGDFFQAVAKNDPRMQQVAQVRAAASGQNITVDADGGYLVPPEYAEGLLRTANAEAVLASKVQRVPVTSNRLIVNKLKDEDRTDGNRGGGVLAYWAGEAEQYTASKAKFEQDQTDLHKLTGLCFATDEMLEDDVAMDAFLSQSFGEEFAFQEDNVILNGDGNKKPRGILDAGNTALVTIAKEADQGAGTVWLENILKMYNAMPVKNRANAEWYINQDIELILLQMLMRTGGVTTGDAEVNLGVPVFLPAGGLTGSPHAQLLGRPVVPVEQCAAVGSKGDIVFADLSQYRLIEKGGLRADTSIHVRFDYGEQAFRFTLRLGGKPIWTRPMIPYKGSTARSPYVTLAARG